MCENVYLLPIQLDEPVAAFRLPALPVFAQEHADSIVDKVEGPFNVGSRGVYEDMNGNVTRYPIAWHGFCVPRPPVHDVSVVSAEVVDVKTSVIGQTVVAESTSTTEAANEVPAPLNLKSTSFAYCIEFGVPCDGSQETTAAGQRSNAFGCGVNTPCICREPLVDILTTRSTLLTPNQQIVEVSRLKAFADLQVRCPPLTKTAR